MGLGRGRGGANFPRTLYLERWKATQSKRRAELAEVLSSKRMTPQLQEELQAWRQNLQTKGAWLQARLDHVRAVDQLLEGILEKGTSSP